MIPGVNDEHLKEVPRSSRPRALSHNVMPLIAEAEHGTYYGLMEQPSPETPEQLQALHECGGDMAMMRHCRQCRADAVGLLAKTGAEFTDKAGDMDIDHEAAMQTRQEVRENLRKTGPPRTGAPAAEVTALAGVPADSRPVLMAVAAKMAGGRAPPCRPSSWRMKPRPRAPGPGAIARRTCTATAPPTGRQRRRRPAGRSLLTRHPRPVRL